MRLNCRTFGIETHYDSLPVVRAEFIVPISPHETKKLAEAFKAITLYMGETIELVKSRKDMARCFYCGQLNTNDRETCVYCGGRMPLPGEAG